MNIIHENPSKEEKIAASALLTMRRRNEWYLDSGASSHMTPFSDLLANQVKSNNNEIVTADNTHLKAKMQGDAKLKINGHSIGVTGVLHVPELSVNLLSVYNIASKGNELVFNANGCTIYDNKKRIVAQCKAENGMYKFETDLEKCFIASSKYENAMLWHRRLGHLNVQSMKKMKNGAVERIKYDDDVFGIENCEVCAMGKQSRQPFHRSKNESKNILDLIHSDLVGPMETLSIGKAKYIMTFIDDHSKKAFVYFLKYKSEAYDKFVEFKNYVETQTERKIKILRTDNGTEYINHQFDRSFKLAGIEHQLTAPYTPQQNGVAERFNRTMIERAKCLLFDAKLPKTFWAEAVNMATYLINRTINTNDQIPEEIWTGRKMNLSHIKLFGAEVMVHVPKEKRHKLDPKSEKLIFVGYDAKSKAYRCMNPKTRKLTISRDVIFHETVTSNDQLIVFMDNLDEVRENETDDNQVIVGEINNQILDTDEPVDVNPTDNASINITPRAEITSDEGGSSDENLDPPYEPDESIGEVQATDRATRSGMRFWNFANFACENNSEFALKCDEKNPSDDP